MHCVLSHLAPSLQPHFTQNTTIKATAKAGGVAIYMQGKQAKRLGVPCQDCALADCSITQDKRCLHNLFDEQTRTPQCANLAIRLCLCPAHKVKPHMHICATSHAVSHTWNHRHSQNSMHKGHHALPKHHHLSPSPERTTGRAAPCQRPLLECNFKPHQRAQLTEHCACAAHSKREIWGLCSQDSSGHDSRAQRL